MSEQKQAYGWGDRVWVDSKQHGRYEGVVIKDDSQHPWVSYRTKEGIVSTANLSLRYLSPRDDEPRPKGWRLPEAGDTIKVIKDDDDDSVVIGRTFRIAAIDWQDNYPIAIQDGYTFKPHQIELVRLHDDPETETGDAAKVEAEPITTPEPKPTTTHDPVNKPSHYKRGGIEVIDFLEAYLTPDQFEGYLLGTQLAYNSRANWKGSMDEDLRKAEWYQKRLVAFREKRKD